MTRLQQCDIVKGKGLYDEAWYIGRTRAVHVFFVDCQYNAAEISSMQCPLPFCLALGSANPAP